MNLMKKLKYFCYKNQIIKRYEHFCCCILDVIFSEKKSKNVLKVLFKLKKIQILKVIYQRQNQIPKTKY